ncbi:MAG: SBBP repeat-containing protein [Bacteroidota bacterium]
MKKQIQFFFILFGCLIFNHAIAQLNYKWVKSISSTGLGNDKGYSIAVDDSGFVYVTGIFGGGVAPADFNPFGTPISLVGAGALNCFFAKYNANGDCVWAKTLDASNGSSGSLGKSIALDTAGNIYLAGAFLGTVDFNPSNQTFYQVSSSGDLDGFVAKYDNNGNFQWIKSQGGALLDIANGVALDITGNVYVTGVFKSGNFESQGAGTQFYALGAEDIFIAKYDNAGIFQWANPIGGADRDIATAIAVDKFGNAYLTGSFKGTVDFDPGPGTVNQTVLGTADAIFFAKYDPSGAYIISQKLSGSSGSGLGTSIAVDTVGKFYVTGAFSGSVDFNPIGGQVRTSFGAKDMFYAKYNQFGEYEFAYPIGTPATAITDSAIGSSIVLDHIGNIYITGSFQGQADFDPSSADETHTSATDGGDIFFAKYDNAGNYLWAKSLCTGLEDAGTSIAVDTAGSVYVTGYYQGTVNFDIGAGMANRVSSAGTQDIFFAKYRPGGTSTISGNVFDNFGNPVTAGYVYLYTQYTNDGNAAMHLVDITSIQTGGDYSFFEVYSDSYLVLAIADSLTYFSSLAATYYSDSIHWEQATPIVITAPFTNFSTANINMMGLQILNGSASLSGVIFEGFGYDRTAGTPIQGTPIGLEGDPGSIIAYTSTDVDGKYTFNNLRAGCYKIYVNIPGLPMDSTYHKCLDSLEIATNLNFIADSGSIFIDPILLAVEQIVSSSIKMNIYPNPHRGVATIEFTIHETSMVKLELFNLLGEKVAELLNEQKPAGSVKCKFNAANTGLNAGIYLLNLKVGDEISSKKIIQIE